MRPTSTLGQLVITQETVLVETSIMVVHRATIRESASYNKNNSHHQQLLLPKQLQTHHPKREGQRQQPTNEIRNSRRGYATDSFSLSPSKRSPFGCPGLKINYTKNARQAAATGSSKWFCSRQEGINIVGCQCCCMVLEIVQSTFLVMECPGKQARKIFGRFSSVFVIQGFCHDDRQPPQMHKLHNK